VEVYFPQKKEYNIDHRVTNMMVQEVLGHLNLNPIKFQYAIAWLFPYNVVAHIIDERKFYLFMSSILNLSIVYEDISKFLNLKKKALEAYKTQLMAFSYKERKNIIKRSFLNSFLEKKEKFFVTP
jgi:LmbE family N-acetylglucosaminyl deacetylase